jgi:DNA-binding NtrC family response regulator
MKEKILIVDDDKTMRWTMAQALQSWGYVVAEAGTVADGLAAFDLEQPTVVLLDINLPDGSGLDALREIKRRQPQAVVIIVSSSVLVDDAVSALRGGAYDFVSKPPHLDELQVRIRNGIEAQQLRKEVGTARQERAKKFSFDQIIGESDAMTEMKLLARKVAESEVSAVLLQGESGTGKDLLAQAIHYASHRFNGPFVAINCAALPGTLIESELFGYEKGAFTDAKTRKEGLFEQAEEGTLFLDEIGELELGLQAKLLRVFEERRFRRVGGLKDISLDVRVIAASNRDLKAESDAGKFRLDLYYRLSVIQIDVPPLRSRPEDTVSLTRFFIDQFNKQLRKNIKGLSDEVAAIFRNYAWPGNVRELRNVVERVMILEDGDTISPRFLPRGLVTAERSTEPAKHLAQHDEGMRNGDAFARQFRLPEEGVSLDAVETSLVRQAMSRSGGNQTRAADLLGITRDQLRYRLKKIGEEL